MHEGRSPSYKRYEYDRKQAQEKRRKGTLFEGREALFSLKNFLSDQTVAPYISNFKNGALWKVFHVFAFGLGATPTLLLELSYYDVEKNKYRPEITTRELDLRFKKALDDKPQFIGRDPNIDYVPIILEKSLTKLWKEWVQLRIEGKD